MKIVRYSRYTGDDFGLSAEDLLQGALGFLPAKRLRQPLHAVQRVQLSTRSKI